MAAARRPPRGVRRAGPPTPLWRGEYPGALRRNSGPVGHRGRARGRWLGRTTPGGKLIFQVFAALAEFERGLIEGPTRAGLAAARARGRVGRSAEGGCLEQCEENGPGPGAVCRQTERGARYLPHA